MRRRKFIALLRGVAIVHPLSAFAQQHAPLVQIRPVVMTPEEFRIAYPKVQAWIQKTLAAYEKDAQPIASMHFARLPRYFDYDLLETTKFILIDQVPMPPLSAMGLDRFAAFEQGNFNGVTRQVFYKADSRDRRSTSLSRIDSRNPMALTRPRGFS
jgi:hypothetical protein